jgi:hypothetical protein
MKLFKVFFIFLFSLSLGSKYAQGWTVAATNTSPGGFTSTMSQYLNNGYAVSCDGGSDGQVKVEITGGVGPFDIEWSNGAENVLIITGLPASTVAVTVYDNGTIISGDPDELTVFYSIASPIALTFKATGTAGTAENPPTCSYLSDGRIRSKAQGGIFGTYTYLWDDASNTTSRTLPNVGHGTYTVTATDANNCIATKTYTVNLPTAVVPNLEVTTEGCDGSSGILTAVPAGGSGVYSSYLWNTGSSSNPLTGLSAGTYSIDVRDNTTSSWDGNTLTPTGCLGTESIVLNSPTAISVNSTTNLVSCNGGNDGSANIVVSGGKAPYNISWTGTLSGNPAGDEISVSGGNYTMSFLREGSYNVTILDDNGCTETTTVVISEPIAIAAAATKKSGCHL